MSVNKMVEQIVTATVSTLDIDFKLTTTFKELGPNYPDIAQIPVELEDIYDIDVTDEEVQEVANVGDWIACIERKLHEKGRS